MSVPAPKQLKYTAGIANGSARDSAAVLEHARKVSIFSIPLLVLELSSHFSSKNGAIDADGTNWKLINEEVSSCRTRRETMEMEEKSSSMAVTVQMEMAETMETFRMDQA